ncbi:microsomal signal peptidase-like protein subunit [Piedraia hortae CBS 480.64]|uniref:Signal peptidase subunit 3 n=1 Tax=Piedraia hortae CBS 480.64 TaxID=1314780 RepID=A0A6A7CCM2_9PEZI|nr:microsomal signal peptidase-like protein subunit [Piedraia hortae CBS 480.64]
MYNNLVRLQNVFGYLSSVAFAVAGVIAVSVVLFRQDPTASLALRNVQVVRGRPHYYSTKREEYAHIRFDLDADLSSLFNYNTKQVFLYITASYPSSDPARVPNSESIIWDAIIPSELALTLDHPNTYIHPTTPGATGRRSKLRTKNKPYPTGTQPGIVRLQNQKPKYQITDISGRMAERANATLHLHWNIQPWVGFLTWDKAHPIGKWKPLEGNTSPEFTFPVLKGTGNIPKEDLKTETGAERNRGSPA